PPKSWQISQMFESLDPALPVGADHDQGVLVLALELLRLLRQVGPHGLGRQPRPRPQPFEGPPRSFASGILLTSHRRAAGKQHDEDGEERTAHDPSPEPGSIPRARTGVTPPHMPGWAPASVRPRPAPSPCGGRSPPPDRASRGPPQSSAPRGG